MHQYGDVVTMVRPDQKGGLQKTNALVVQSQKVADGEHLTVVYLDPNQASASMAGAAVDKAITKAFVTPLTEGKQYGWEEPEAGPDLASAREVLAEMDKQVATLTEQRDGARRRIEQLDAELAKAKAVVNAKPVAANPTGATSPGTPETTATLAPNSGEEKSST